MAELIQHNGATGLPVQDITEQVRAQFASLMGKGPNGVQVVLLVAVPEIGLIDWGTTMGAANTAHALRTVGAAAARNNGAGSKLILPV